MTFFNEVFIDIFSKKYMDKFWKKRLLPQGVSTEIGITFPLIKRGC
jgi:hypothetical protein